MEKKNWFLWVIFLFLLGGMIFYLLRNDFLIVKWHNMGFSITNNIDKSHVNSKKKVFFYFWKDGEFKKEPFTVVCFPYLSDNIKYVANLWFDFMREERVIKNRVIIDFVGISSDGSLAFISFDRNPNVPEWSIWEKITFWESFLKTLNGLDLGIREVFLMENHSFLEDDHLDFNIPWPIDGFIG